MHGNPRAREFRHAHRSRCCWPDCTQRSAGAVNSAASLLLWAMVAGLPRLTAAGAGDGQLLSLVGQQ
jgi:hypothetical protein